MDDFYPLAASTVVAALVFALVKWCRKGSSPVVEEPPSAGATRAIVSAIKEKLAASVASTTKSLEGDDPAGDLADKGNARDRR
jgi:hypothetical protein